MTTLAYGSGDDIIAAVTVTMYFFGGSGKRQPVTAARERTSCLAGRRLWFRLWLQAPWRGRLLYVGRKACYRHLYGVVLLGGKYERCSGGSGGSKNPPYGSASGQDINDILYVEGPVTVTLQSGETFTLTPGQMRQIG